MQMEECGTNDFKIKSKKTMGEGHHIDEEEGILGEICQPIEEKLERVPQEDDEEFFNWKIANIMDGIFMFEEMKEVAVKVEESKLKLSKQGKPKNKSVKTKTIKGNNTEETHLKVSRTKGDHQSSSNKELSSEQIVVILSKMKPIKLIYSHFCKENNLTSIKSTLFEDKPTAMEEMNLNKWMVFCKQFGIIDKLYALRSKDRNQFAGLELSSITYQTVKEQIKVKELKQVENILINVYKSINHKKSKINYSGFIAGLVLIFEEFKDVYPSDSEGCSKFIEEIMYSASEKESLVKLSCLKFTHSTPKISYEKSSFPEINMTTIFKSRPKLGKENSSLPRSTLNIKIKAKSINKLQLNPVLSEAKHTIKHNDNSKYIKQLEIKKKVDKKNKASKDENGIKKDLVQYFESNQDPILNRYFMMQTHSRVKKTGNSIA